MEEEQSDDVELGKDGADLPLWLAQEAVRQGEAYLKEIAASADGLITRAVAILGWSVTVAIASIGVLTTGRLPWVAGAAAIAALSAALLAIAAAWPRFWRYAAFSPTWLTRGADGTTSQLQALETMAQGYQNAIDSNLKQVRARNAWLQAAWVALSAAPILAGAAWLWL